MKLINSIELPANQGTGGFDHAAIHQDRMELYVAHTSNSAVDVIDIEADRYLYPIEGLTGVAGALVNEHHSLVFSSNRGEDTVGFWPAGKSVVRKAPVCTRPNGLAFDEARGTLLAAGVGEPYSLTILNIKDMDHRAEVGVPGRTRWTVYDLKSDRFYVNVGDPALILVLKGSKPAEIERSLSVPAKGPHGLDIDSSTGRLFCACDEGRLIVLEAGSGNVLAECGLSGTPDVIWFNPALRRLYVAVGDPGVIDVIDTDRVERIEVVETEKGAHTTALDLKRNRIYAFLPQSCKASVYVDG